MLYRCYAKINLSLEILGRRPDGFHELTSLVHTISLADDLRVEPADELLTRVEGLDIDPETNLVARAARLLAAEANTRSGAELSLVKRIPAAAGLGGGSSDAATTLVGLNTLWGSRLGLHDLERVASDLGSDVPFFVRGGAALMRSRGEELEVLPPLQGQWLVLVVPPHDITDKTRRLYATLEAADFTSGDRTTAAAQCVDLGATPLEDQLVNGFERAARGVFTGLSETWTAAERVARRRFFLSGAGPALFAFAAGRQDAHQQLKGLTRLNVEAFAVRTVKHARTSLRFAPRTAIEYI